MNYRSYADLSRVIVRNIARLPRDIDLVVAVPRSGYLAAGIIALTLNRPLIDLAGFLEGRVPQHGNSRKPFTHDLNKHALVVDDSVLTGSALREIRNRISGSEIACNVSYAAVFVTAQSKRLVDYFFDICPFPRQFEWNVFHHEHLTRCCVMFDGVIANPSKDVPYSETRRFIIPTYPIHHIIALDHGQSEADIRAWLTAHHVMFEKLTLIGSPGNGVLASSLAEEKAQLYAKDHTARLFIEEDPVQAPQIAHLAGKPVLCTRTQKLCRPQPFLVSTLTAKSIQVSRGLARRMRSFLG